MANSLRLIVWVYRRGRLLLRCSRQLWWRYTLSARVRSSGVRVGERVHFLAMPVIWMEPQSLIEIGDGSTLCSSVEFTALGVNHPVVLRTLRSGAEIRIGRDTGISGGSICAAKSVTIGDECLIGADVMLSDTDFHTIAPERRRFNNSPDAIASSPVIVEDNVFIGARSIILKGVTIGRNSVVGAGSVVTKNVPPDSIVAGNPARIIKRPGASSDVTGSVVR